jgi:RimJ/RimL family protein N-acetyltransferase
MEVEITRMAAEYVEGFHRALDFVARERRYLAFLEAPPLESTRQFVLNNIAKGYPQFVAVTNGIVVGWCDVIPKSRPIHAHSGVLGMGLLPPFRGQGHGVALIQATLSEARRVGLVRFELTVHADNKRAIALYERLGFKKEGTMKSAALIDEHYKDVILMAIVDCQNATLKDPRPRPEEDFLVRAV